MRPSLADIARSVWAWRREVLFGVERFPVAIAALAIFVGTVNLEIAGIITMGVSPLARLGAATSSAAALATAVILFAEANGRRGVPAHVVSLGAGLVIGGAVWFWTFLGAAPPALLTAAVLAIPLAPYVRRRWGFWSFLWQLAHAAALAFLAVVIFCAGVSAILASLEYLFGVRIDNSLYGLSGRRASASSARSSRSRRYRSPFPRRTSRTRRILSSPACGFSPTSSRCRSSPSMPRCSTPMG